MGVKDWYKEYLLRKEQEKQNNNTGFKGFSNPLNREMNQKIYDSYINQSADDAEKIRNSQNTGASVGDTASNIVDGFAKGGIFGGVLAAAQAKEKARENAKRNAQAIGQQTMQNAENQTKALMNDLDTPNTLQAYNPNNYNIYGTTSPETINAQVYQNYLNNNPVQTGNIAQEEVKNGLLNKFVNGISDFSRGYQENRNNGFNPNNLLADKFTETITTPGDKKALEGYTKSLKTMGYSDDVIEGVKEGRNSGIKPIADYINQHPEMYDKTVTNTYDKGKMGKIGEFVGSVARVAQKPLVQGALATAASAAMGNPFALASGYKFANNRAMSNIYENALREQGINVPNSGLFGNYDNKDFSALMTPQYKNAAIELSKAQFEALKAHREWEEQERERHNKEMEAIHKQDADTKQKRVDHQINKPVKGNDGGGNTKKKYELKNVNNKTNSAEESTNNIVDNVLNKKKNKKSSNNQGWAF